MSDTEYQVCTMRLMELLRQFGYEDILVPDNDLNNTAWWVPGGLAALHLKLEAEVLFLSGIEQKKIYRQAFVGYFAKEIK